MTTDRARRLRLVGELIEAGGVHSQEQLRDLLLEYGVDATQATISRDLRELGVVKGPEGYVLSVEGGVAVAARDPRRDLERALLERLLSADTAVNLVVLRTPPGHAQALAVVIDATRPQHVVGTLAGDDTIFLAMRSAAEARRLCEEIRRLAGLEGPDE